jgi:hypothetical protein
VPPHDLRAIPKHAATAAFLIIKDQWLCCPGAVFSDLIEDYDFSSTLPHVMWTSPFPWDQLGAVRIQQDLVIHWLLAIPISGSERQLLIDRGFAVFESMLEEQQIKYFELDRSPIVAAQP